MPAMCKIIGGSRQSQSTAEKPAAGPEDAENQVWLRAPNVQPVDPVELSRVQSFPLRRLLKITFFFTPCQVHSKNPHEQRKPKGRINDFITAGASAGVSHAHCFAEASLCSGLVFSDQCKYKCCDSVLPPGAGREVEGMDDGISSTCHVRYRLVA